MALSTRRTAIVTGSSRGIGAAIAERLAKDGFNVVVNYSGKADDADALTAKIVAAGGRAIAVQGDVADPAAVKNLFDRAEAEFGGIDLRLTAMVRSNVASSASANFASGRR